MNEHWCTEARKRLAAMESLVAQGHGDTLVQGGGCTQPGGGIVPTTRTAREMADHLRGLLGTFCASSTISEQVFLGGRPTVGFGDRESEEKKFYGVMVGLPLLGVIAGAAGGGILGHKHGGGINTVLGVVAGGIVGGGAGVAAGLGTLMLMNKEGPALS